MPTDLDNLMKGQVLICCFTRALTPRACKYAPSFMENVVSILLALLKKSTFDCKLFLQLLGITGNRAVITKDLLRHLQCMKSRNESSTRSADYFSLIDTCFKENQNFF